MAEKNKNFAVIGVSSILLVAAVVGTVTYGVTKKNGEDAGSQTVSTSSKATHNMCQYTDYKDTCEKSLADAGDNNDPTHIAQVAFKAAIEGIKEVIGNSTLLKEAATDPKTSQAFEVCKEVLDNSIDDLERSIEKIGSFNKANIKLFISDLTTWLSGAGTFQETCLDAFENTTGDTGEKMKKLMKTTSELTSNGLAIVAQLDKILSGLKIPGFSRRLQEVEDNGDYYTHNFKGQTRRLQEVEDNSDYYTHNFKGQTRRLQEVEDNADYYTHNFKGQTRRLQEVEDNGDYYTHNFKGQTRRLQEVEDNGDYYNHHDKDKARRLLEVEDNGDYYNHNDKEKGRRLLEVEDNGDYYNHNYKGQTRRLQEAEDNDDYYNHNNKNQNRRLQEAEDNDDYYNHNNKNQNRRLQEVEDNGEYYNDHNRHLLQADPSSLTPNAVVALDGSGQFKSIQEAVNTAPIKVNRTFIIKVKEGVYQEYVEIPKKVYNVMLIGEGPTKTKITGNKNVIDGTPTFKSATVAVNGDNFIARDIGFENTAGAIKHQAVALRVTADRCIFYNCNIDGYQDTLYAHTHRQYYRDCIITGTIDFIFGDAAAVFQNCKLIVRKPLDTQACMVTAQGRKDPRSKGATVLQNCIITAEEALLATKPMPKVYLGRPWKEYSRTLVMQSFIDSVIAPEGWAEWAGKFALDTLSYAEYQNRGPGSDTAKRVKWKGLMQNLSPEQAASFTPGPYIDGKDWIEGTSLPYDSGMMQV